MSEDLSSLRDELTRTRAELRAARARIAAMEASRFWKLRNAWWRLKARLTGSAGAGAWGTGAEAAPESGPGEVLRAEEMLPPDARVAAGERILLEARERRDTIREEGRRRFGGRRVLFVLPVAERGGGANVVLSEARALRAMGVDACVANIPRLRGSFERSYGNNAGVPVVWAAPEAMADAARGFDAVVATAHFSVPWLAPLDGKGPVLGYYVQDYEPWFYDEGMPEYAAAKATYTQLSGMRLFTKTEWNRDVLRDETGAEAVVVGASFDVDAFHVRLPAPPEGPFRVAAMIRPSSPRRGPERTMKVLASLAREMGDALEVFTFGVDARDDAYRRLASFPHRHLGVVDEERLAVLLGRVHVFADLSDYQAMGLTALEALACGATAIVPRPGGAASFARDGQNALVVDTESERECAEALRRLACDQALRARLTAAAPRVAVDHPPEGCAVRMLQALFDRR